MDGGVHEKAKISVFKDIVKRAKLQKRRECSNYISPEMNAASPTQTVFAISRHVTGYY
jgi:hypothetical protein